MVTPSRSLSQSDFSRVFFTIVQMKHGFVGTNGGDRRGSLIWREQKYVLFVQE
jgi:hypothetical protein